MRFQDCNFDDGKTYDVWRAYGQSKTANNLMALSLAKKLGGKGLIATSIHPGVIATTLMLSNRNKILYLYILYCIISFRLL